MNSNNSIRFFYLYSSQQCINGLIFEFLNKTSGVESNLLPSIIKTSLARMFSRDVSNRHLTKQNRSAGFVLNFKIYNKPTFITINY